MLDVVTGAEVTADEPRPARARRLRQTRRVGSWLLLTGWIVLPLMPAMAFALSKLLGLEF